MTGETQTAETPFGSLVSIGLEQTSTVDRVVEELRRAVFEGELESGTPLREVALAESLGVSRPTVREALTVLVADGLATREPHRGVAVATPDPESIGDVSRARGVLELAGVRHWATAEEADREAVRTALQEYGAAVARSASYERAQPAAPGHPPLARRADRVAAAGGDGRPADRRAEARARPGRPGPPATPPTRPPPTSTCSTCSRPATSTRPRPSWRSTSTGAESAILERLGLEPDPSPADQ